MIVLMAVIRSFGNAGDAAMIVIIRVIILIIFMIIVIIVMPVIIVIMFVIGGCYEDSYHDSDWRLW